MSNRPVDKPFKTYDQMLDILESRHVIISNRSFAKDVLASVSYYTLINGYKNMFSFNENDVFNPPVLFEDFYILQKFDFELNNILFKYIISIENMLKSHLSYRISENYGVVTDLSKENALGDEDYLAKSHYRNTSKTNNILYKIKKYASDSKNIGIQHYARNHNHIPCWILINGIPFGIAIQWYNILKPDDKSYVAEKMLRTSKLNIEEKKEFILKALKILRLYRNSIAHGNIVFSNTINVELPKRQTVIIANGFITQEDYLHGIGRTDLIATIIAISAFIPDRDKEMFISQITAIFEDISETIFSNGNTIYDFLNLPANFTAKLQKLK